MIVTVALLRHGGSHLIRPIVAALGAEIVEPGNFGAPEDSAEGPVIVFIRDPRDITVAKYRWRESRRPRAVTADEEIARILSPERIDIWEVWAKRWCRWPGALVVRFEDVRNDGPVEIDRIAAHIGTTCFAAELFEQVYGKGQTYSGKHSNWRETFGPLSHAAWRTAGGRRLLDIMGYA